MAAGLRKAKQKYRLAPDARQAPRLESASRPLVGERARSLEPVRGSEAGERVAVAEVLDAATRVGAACDGILERED